MPSKKRPYQFPTPKELNIQDQINAWKQELSRYRQSRTWKCECGKLNKIGKTLLEIVLANGYSSSGGAYTYEPLDPDLNLVCENGCKIRATKYKNKELWEFASFYTHSFGAREHVERKERGH